MNRRTTSLPDSVVHQQTW